MGIKRGDIYYIGGGYSVGSETRSRRPAVVVSNDMNNKHSTVLEVVYLTSQPKHFLPTHVDILSAPRKSIALCEQITSVAAERFGDYCGRVTEQELQLIEAAMMISLGFVDDGNPPTARERISTSGSNRSQMCCASRDV